MNLKDQMDRIYGSLAPAEIPWNVESPPGFLVELVESRRVTPCRAVDLGCGAGNYAVWLAARGFDVTGVDISPRALDLARRLAAARGVACRFVAADLLGDLGEFDSAFDFAYDWEVLHHVFPKDRARYVANVDRMLRPGARYLSVCFSEEDHGFGGEGKFRTTPLGTTLYFSSEQELRELFQPLFHIEELGTVDAPGRQSPHRAVRALLMKSKSSPARNQQE
jgi:SAM-dependent methyltransferase